MLKYLVALTIALAGGAALVDSADTVIGATQGTQVTQIAGTLAAAAQVASTDDAAAPITSLHCAQVAGDGSCVRYSELDAVVPAGTTVTWTGSTATQDYVITVTRGSATAIYSALTGQLSAN